MSDTTQALAVALEAAIKSGVGDLAKQVADLSTKITSLQDTILAGGKVPTPTPSPAPSPAPAPTPTPAPTGDTKIRIASSPNGMAFDRRRTTPADRTEVINSFPIILGPYGAKALAMAFHNDHIGSEMESTPGATVSLSKVTIYDQTTASKGGVDFVAAYKELGMSQAILASDFGYSSFPANKKLTGSVVVKAPAAVLIPSSMSTQHRTGFQAFYADGDGKITGNAGDGVAVPQIVGIVPLESRSFGFFGDSWFRKNDYPAGSFGFGAGVLADIAEKAMLDPKTGSVTPFINCSRYGYGMSAEYDPAKDARLVWAPYIDDAIDGLILNEEGLGLETIKKIHLAFWAALKKANKDIRIWKTAGFGRNIQTTDSYATIAGQTPTGTSAPGALEDQFADWCRSKVADGTLAGFIPYDSLKDPSNKYKFKPGIMNRTAHPTPESGAIDMAAAELRGILFGSTVSTPTPAPTPAPAPSPAPSSAGFAPDFNAPADGFKPAA